MPPVSTRRATCPDPRLEDKDVVVPLDVDSAAELVCGCSLDLTRVRLENERTFVIRTHDGVGRAIRNTWLRERDTGVAKVLLDLGVQYPDDQSSLMLSAAWHHANGLTFDARTRVKCWEDALKAARAAQSAGIREQMVQTPEGIPVPPPPPQDRCFETLR